MTETQVPFMDLSWQWRQIESDVRPELDEVFAKSQFVLGPQVEKFEQAFADYIGAPHCVAASSGTSALHLAVIAAGIGPGDKVLLPAHTFIATAWGVLYQGGIPVFCDVERETGNMDMADAARRLSDDVKAIIPVHLYGQPADMDAVLKFAEENHLTVIEDAAQSHGARHGDRRVGSFGAFGCFSFYPGKNLGAAGEGGAVVCRNADAAERMRALRHHAQSERYIHQELGYNYRMDGIQGLVLRHKLARLDEWTDMRRHIAALYRDGLADLPLELPEPANRDHVYHLFVVRTPKRQELADHLSSKGLQTGLHYPVPLHRQPALKSYAADESSYPVSDHYADECLSLPLFSGMSDGQADLVIAAVREFFLAD